MIKIYSLYKFVLESINSKISVKIHRCFIFFYKNETYTYIVYTKYSHIYMLWIWIQYLVYVKITKFAILTRLLLLLVFFVILYPHYLSIHYDKLCFNFPFLHNYPKLYSITMQHLRSLTEKNYQREHFVL